MKLLKLFEATKKGKYKADQVYNLYMPNSGEDGVLIGWRGDWPEDHFIEFRGLPYSKWTHAGDDFQRVHDRLAGMRATVLHHNSVVNVLPGMPEHEDIARAINGGELPEWDKDRAFNEDVYHATTHDIDEFNPLSHFGNAETAAGRAKSLRKYPERGALRTYRANVNFKNPIMMKDYGEDHDTAYDIADGILGYYSDDDENGDVSDMRMMQQLRVLVDDWKAEFMTNTSREEWKELDKVHRKELVAFLKSHGHDGIEYENQGEGFGSTSYISLDPVIAESAQAGVTINYNGESKVGVKPARARTDVLMMLPTAAMDAAFKGTMYVGPGGTGAAIGKRYEMFQQWIEEHDTYEVPEVYVHTDGTLSFTNGRHRYAVFRDSGVEQMPVAMSRSGIQNAEKFLGGVIREANYSEPNNILFHVSNDALPDGTVLKPQGKEWTPADKILERYRPQGYLSRQEAVFLFPSYDDADSVGLNGIHGHVEGYLYEVEPAGGAGDRSWHHVWWYDQIVRELRDAAVNELDEHEAIELSGMLREYARRYWEGDDGPENGWEIMVKAGTIVKYLGPAEDVLYESRILRESINAQLLKDAAPKALAMLRKELAHANVDDANTDFEIETDYEGDEPDWDEKFAVWKEGYAQRRVGMAIGEISRGAEFIDGKMIVHRMIEADEDFIIKMTQSGLGMYWTWDKEHAEAYAGDGGEEWVVTGAVDPMSIDWVQTIYMNAHPATGQAEKEITIPEGTPIKLMGLELNGEPVDPSQYERGRMLMASIGESQLDDDFARGHAEGQIAGIKAAKEYKDSPHGREPEFDSFHNISNRGRITKANGYEKAYQFGYQDGYYTIIAGGDAEYLISKITANLDGSNIMSSIGESHITELRDKTYQYIKSLLPNWPDYVLKDLVYPNVKRESDIKDSISNMLRGMELSADTKWQLIPNMQFTPDMWNADTLRNLKARAGGSDLGMQISRDAERHDTQAKLAQQQGGVRDEPVIIIRGSDGYELIEGWHRTIQHFAKYPQGYVGPAWVAQS